MRLLKPLLGLLLLLPGAPLRADDAPSLEVAASPREPWGELPPAEEASPWWRTTLLWIPNRVLDLIDIFRVDLGVGPSFGAVVRVTKYGQAGYRSMSPLSLRVGDFGRRAPVLIEHSNEFGIGPAFVNSSDRAVCTGEVGAGADLLLIGGYAGICVEEVVDFLGGLFLFDPRDDDLR